MNAISKTPIATLIIPYYNSANTIDRCLSPLINDKGLYDIILVDDGSDQEHFLKDKYPQLKVITHSKNRGPSAARNTGMKNSNTELYIFIDADVIISNEDINKLIMRFKDDSSWAFTLQHSKLTATDNFYSKYKAYYMNYSFSQSGQYARFIYSSLCGLKKTSLLNWPEDIRYGEDSYLATQVLNKNKRISFYNDVELQHLKEYSLISLLRNDFNIPYHFVTSYMNSNTNGNHAHTNKKQITAIALTPFIYLTWPIWIICNYSFFSFTSKLGLLKVILLTLVDQFVMGCGILSGFITYSLLSPRKFPKKGC
jgi:glycosyltransferase involved in cell wall biosynthesis